MTDAETTLATYWWGRWVQGDAVDIAQRSIKALRDAGFEIVRVADLEDAVVEHVDGDSRNNDPANLAIRTPKKGKQ